MRRSLARSNGLFAKAITVTSDAANLCKICDLSHSGTGFLAAGLRQWRDTIAMIRVLGCIFEQHDLRLVVLAAGLCVFACATALTMITRARAAEAAHLRLTWLMGAGAVAGCGIWATHFVGMLAYSAGMPIAFAADLTILSVIIAMVLCGLGFFMALTVSGAMGGVLIGLAISAMHYTGMAAVNLPARAIWDTSYVAASILIGVSLSGLALHFALRGKHRGDYVLGAGLFTLAIVGMHFTGMTAVQFLPEAGRISSGMAIDHFTLAVMVAAGAAFILGQALIVALVDRYLSERAQGESLRMRAHIAELETTQQALKKARLRPHSIRVERVICSAAWPSFFPDQSIQPAILITV